MATISILDTGYLKTTNAPTQLGVLYRANSGSLIELKSVNFVPTVKANLDFKPVIGTFQESEVHLVSIENMGFTISGLLNTDNSNDMDLIWAMVQLCRTRGYKAMFYNVDRSTTDTGGNTTLERDSQLVTRLANSHYDTTEPQTGISFSLWTGITTASGKNLTNVYHLMVRFIDLQMTQVPNSKMINFTLKGVSTK